MTTPIIEPTTYASWRATTLGAITEQVETALVFELAGPLAGKRVLDVGTGDGTYAIEAARRGALVTGIDLEPSILMRITSTPTQTSPHTRAYKSRT